MKKFWRLLSDFDSADIPYVSVLALPIYSNVFRDFSMLIRSFYFLRLIAFAYYATLAFVLRLIIFKHLRGITPI